MRDFADASALGVSLGAGEVMVAAKSRNVIRVVRKRGP